MLFGDSGDSPLPGPGLVGIARLASESEVLEAKRAVEYHDLECRSLLHKTRPGMPFGWGLNPYRGCEFGCRYCYARYTHEFMELRQPEDFEYRIFAKSNVQTILRRDLKRIVPGRGTASTITIGTATDPYQPAERRFGRTRAALEVFAEFRGLTVGITTKSDLVARDVELMKRIAEHNRISVNMTITTVDRDLARDLEPRAPRPDLRLKAVETIAKAGIPVAVLPNPIMPGITDDERRLDRVAKAAKDHGATYFGGGVLFLMPCARRVFFPFVAEKFPHLLRRYEERYSKDAYLKGAYLEIIRNRIATIRDRYGLNSRPQNREIAAMDDAQGLLFGS